MCKFTFWTKHLVYTQSRELRQAPSVCRNVEQDKNNFNFERSTSCKYFKLWNLTDFKIEILDL